MAHGTHIKQMESPLQQVTTTMIEINNGVGSMEDMIGLAVEGKIEAVADRLQGDMRDHLREEMWEEGNMLRDQLQQFMLMFSSQN